MLKVRKEQIDVFKQAAVCSFEDRMVEHMKRFSPKHSNILDDSEIRECIRQAWEKAESYEFKSERSIRLYIEMSFMLGSGFDADPQMPWVAEMLANQFISDETGRIDRLYDKAWEYVECNLADYSSPSGEVDPKRFIEQIRQLRQESEQVLPESAVSQFCERTIGRLRRTFPHKCEYLGEPTLRRLISYSLELAHSHGITTERGYSFFIAMSFILGSGFDRDPQLPWVSAILNDQRITDQNNRVDQLLVRAVGCLNRWWS